MHLYQSTISLSYQFVFRDRTYIDRSLSCQLEFGIAPITIDHLLVMSVCVSRTAPISIGHCLVSLSRDSTYIDWLSPCHISFYFWDRTYIDRSLSYQFEFSLSRGRTYIDRPSPCHISLCFGTAPISIGYCLVS